MKTSLWVVMLLIVAWLSFLIGYAVSSHTGYKHRVAETPAGVGGYGAPAGGYGAPSGGYGAPAAGGYGAPAAGGYGAPAAGGYGAPAVSPAPAGPPGVPTYEVSPGE